MECFDGLCNVQGCQNRKFAESKIDESPIIVKQTPDKGRGTFASRDLEQHELVVEYVGEVLTKKEGDKRLEEMNKNGAMNFYFMALSSKFVIDAARQGHVGRFLNHSCIPNCRCDLWDVKGVPRLGIFTNCRVPKGTELTYDYKYEVKNPHPDGKGLQVCVAVVVSRFLSDFAEFRDVCVEHRIVEYSWGFQRSWRRSFEKGILDFKQIATLLNRKAMVKKKLSKTRSPVLRTWMLMKKMMKRKTT